MVMLQSCRGLHYIFSIIKACIYLSTSKQRASQPRPASGMSSPRQRLGPDLAGAERLGYKQRFSRRSLTELQLLLRTALLLAAACVGAVNREEPTWASRQRGIRLRSNRATERQITCSWATVTQEQVISGICLESSASPTILAHSECTATHSPRLPYPKVSIYLFLSVHVPIFTFSSFYVIAQ